MKGLTLIFESRRGGSVVRQLVPGLPAEEVKRILRSLRRPAVLELDGEQVGGIDWSDNADDGRIRWQWWFDRQAIEEAR